MRAGIRAGTLQKPTEPTSPAQSIALLCIPDSSTLTCASAGLSQRFSLLFRGSRRKIPQGWPQPTAIFRAQKVKKKKKQPEQKAAAAPCPLPADVRWLLPNPPGQPGSSVTPRGDSPVPSPASRTKRGSAGPGAAHPRSAGSRNKAPGPGIQRNQQHFHANERSRFHPAARGKLERKSGLERMQLLCPMSVAGLQHQSSPSVYF